MKSSRSIVIIFLSLFITYCLQAYTIPGNPRYAYTTVNTKAQTKFETQTNTTSKSDLPTGKASYSKRVLFSDSGNSTSPVHRRKQQPSVWLFIQSLIAGILAVFTPYVYTILPFTVGYLSQATKSKADKIRNILYYALSMIIIFTIFGIVIALIIHTTNLQRFTDHWLFNLFFFRIFAVLGISFMGAFSIKLRSSWVNSTADRAKSGNFRGIFYMALTLPVASFSSTFPIIGLVLLLAGDANIYCPVIGMFGFAVGLALPFVFPRFITIIDSHRSFLNNIRVILGFVSLVIALKFFSNADISLGWHLLDREIFIGLWMLLMVLLGVYMLGKVKLVNDYAPEHNIYGQDYIPLSKLFIAIISFSFAVYLLPGIWGAPLHGVSNFLPR